MMRQILTYIRRKIQNLSSVIEIGIIWIVLSATYCLFLLLQYIFLLFRLIRWRKKITLWKKSKILTINSITAQSSFFIYIIINRSGLCYSPFHHFSGKIVSSTQIIESNDVIFRFIVFDQCNRWYYFDTKSLREEWTLFRIHFTKFRFDMFFR